jgi:hypothetical protein
MQKVFDVMMRILSTLVGLLMMIVGSIWILQGLNLAWGALSRSFMQGNQKWVFYGVLLLLVGVGQVIWSNTRQVKA